MVADPQLLTAQQQMQELTAVSFRDSEDFPTDTSTTGRVLVDGDAFGKIEDAKDADWIKVDLDQYKPYEVRLRPKPSASDPLEDAYIRSIYDSNGYQIPRTSDDDGGGNRSSRVVFSARATGTHYIEARGFSGAFGAYKLSVRALSEDSDSHAPKPETTGALSLDEVTRGSIDRLPDRDWFKITLDEDGLIVSS